MKTKYGFGKIEIITGPMFAGKSEELIRRIKRLMIAGLKVQVFKPAIDIRYSIDCISSHNQMMIKAIPVSSTREIIDNLQKDTEIIGIDEVQFLDSYIVEFLEKWACSGKVAIAAGLDLDFKGEPFFFSDKKMTIAELICRADNVLKLSAICVYKENGKICGAEASRSQRLINGQPASYHSPLVMVSASELYEPRCRKHHIVPDKPESLQLKFDF
ncbi:MAG TPA: thymidine kinase [bacterium]|nr:thymidine kinase [bacterium]HOL48044.1 thymidine kinase [bacterium]HPQ19764.1 thymidine kinase [bacterium]